MSNLALEVCSIPSPAIGKLLPVAPLTGKAHVLCELACGMPFGGLLPHSSFFIVCLLACLISLPALITIACDRTVDRPVPSFVLNHHGSGVAVMGST